MANSTQFPLFFAVRRKRAHLFFFPSLRAKRVMSLSTSFPPFFALPRCVEGKVCVPYPFLFTREVTAPAASPVRVTSDSHAAAPFSAVADEKTVEPTVPPPPPPRLTTPQLKTPPFPPFPKEEKRKPPFFFFLPRTEGVLATSRPPVPNARLQSRNHSFPSSLIAEVDISSPFEGWGFPPRLSSADVRRLSRRAFLFFFPLPPLELRS